MKLGVLGTGMIVREVLPVFERMGIVPSAILGMERSRRQTIELAERYHISNPYFQYEELLAGDTDTVYVALPNALHYSYAKNALLWGTVFPSFDVQLGGGALTDLNVSTI